MVNGHFYLEELGVYSGFFNLSTQSIMAAVDYRRRAMNILDMNGMYGILKNDNGEYVFVVDGKFVGPFTQNQIEKVISWYEAQEKSS